MTVYEVAKDFQPLIAALVALSAAITAYRSAQNVARLQSETSKETNRSQLAARSSERKDESFRRQLALTALVVQTLNNINLQINSRIQFLGFFRNKATKHLDNTYDAERTGYLWNRLCGMSTLHETTRLFKASWEDLSILRAEDQLAIHLVEFAISVADDHIAKVRGIAKDKEMLHEAEVEAAIGHLKNAQETIVHQKPYFENMLQEMAKASM